MTSNQERADALIAALRAAVDRDGDALARLMTDDVRVWTPALSTSTLGELVEELNQRDEAFSDVQFTAAALDVGGDHACVEWTVEMTHSGPLEVGPDVTVEPTGTRVSVHGATVAEFEAERICSVRQYWDEFTVLEQLGAVP